MANEIDENRSEQEGAQQNPLAQDANETFDQPNERWWENLGGSGEVQ